MVIGGVRTGSIRGEMGPSGSPLSAWPQFRAGRSSGASATGALASGGSGPRFILARPSRA